MPTDTVQMARRDGVELVRTGTWQISTGTWRASRQDIAAAVAALSCPAIGKPIIKIGHTDKRFTPGDGEPAIGWYENLRTADGGHTLVGDQVAPSWLTGVQAAAWPNRSVEGTYNYRCGIGHTHPFVLTAVALLGVTPPGVSTLSSLNDVKALYGVAAAHRDPAAGEVRIVASVRAAADDDPPAHTGAMVALIPTAEDAARLAVDGGEPADELHVTLAYLGDAVDLTPAARQDIIAAVAGAVDGMPTANADGFSLALFNPGSSEREPCTVLGMSGADLEVVHRLVADALAGLDLPDQHAPWNAHLTLTYTADPTQLAALYDRTGPVVFDRVRIAFAGERLDIPLLTEPEPLPADYGDTTGDPVMAAADENQLKRFWLGKGLARWTTWTDLYKHLRHHVSPERAKRIAAAWFHDRYGYWPGDRRNRGVHASDGRNGELMPNPTPGLVERIHEAWNASKPPEQQWVVEAAEDEVIVMDNTDRSLVRVPVSVDGDSIRFGAPERVRPAYVPADEPVAAARMVFASRDESRPAPQPADTPAGPDTVTPPAEPAPDITPPEIVPAPELPAAEPEPAPFTEPKEGEDPVSTLSTDVRSRLGLAEDADDNAVMAALDALHTQATAQPDTEQVAASAKAENDELRKEVNVLASQVQTMSAKLAAAEAEKTATVKASVLDEAQRLGKFTPADREKWEKDYDDAPGVVTRVLASIAAGTAVPVAMSGYTGSADTTVDLDAEWERQMAALDGPTATTGGN